MEVAKKIDTFQKMAYRKTAASKILDQLEKLRLSANENNSRRWIWELIQNAKDVVNSKGKIKIRINFDEKNQILEFQHNGSPFTTENLIFLIEQVSSKDRNEYGNNKKTTGKFGTGFLTTHLLSTKVTVCGTLYDNDENGYKYFEVLLDRSGSTQQEIIDSITNTYEQLQTNLKDVYFDETKYNTTFRYNLDEKGMEIAKTGLDDLDIALPYVLAIEPKIESVEIQPSGLFYSLIRTTQVDEVKLHNIVRKSLFDNDTNYELAEMCNDSVSVFMPVKIEGQKISCEPIPCNLARLFCDFPLVGTHDFSFPIVINTDRFNPTEPRDGVFLTDVENDKITENKYLISVACDLFRQLLLYGARYNWKSLYNMIAIPTLCKKDWLSATWVKENVILECRNTIEHANIIDTYSGKRESLLDIFSRKRIVGIPKAKDKEGRNRIWLLAKELGDIELPREGEIEEWHNAFWNECRNLTLKEIVLKVSSLANLEELSKHLVNVTAIQFLNSLYEAIAEDRELLLDIQENNVNIILNQMNVFISCKEAMFDDNIDEIYKDIMALLQEPVRNYLINKNVNLGAFKVVNPVDANDLLKDISLKLESQIKDDDYYLACILILSSYKEKPDNRFYIIRKFYKMICQKSYTVENNKVSYFDNEIYDKALRKLCNEIVEQLSKIESIEGMNMVLNLTSEESKEVLFAFINFLQEQGYTNYFERRNSILPNQYGKFVCKDSLYIDGGIDETLKDLSELAGFDIRKDLLMKEIKLDLPENKIRRNDSIASNIQSFAERKHREDRSKNANLKDFYRKLFLWIKDNDKLAKELFPKIYENLYWLYDDSEISDNMRKITQIEEIMQNCGVTTIDELKTILSSQNHNKYFVSERRGNLTEINLLEWGINSQDALDKAFADSEFAANFCKETCHLREKFEYVEKIIERAKNNIFNYLKTIKEYDLSDAIKIAPTIYIIKKNSQEIYLITRPSDGNEIRLFYGTEIDMLDNSKDWELWVEDGKKDPEKLTFGKIIKLTGINRIPLKKIRG